MSSKTSGSNSQCLVKHVEYQSLSVHRLDEEKKIEAANCRFTGGKNLTGYTSVVEQNVVFIYGENPVMR